MDIESNIQQFFHEVIFMKKQAFKKLLTTAERKTYIAELKKELPFLRLKAGISQDDVANVIGVSRQTYGAIERGDRPMGWSTYLSLIFFFDNKEETHDLVRGTDAFPHKFIDSINFEDTSAEKMMLSLTESCPEVFTRLDANAIETIRSLIMIEYARCTRQPGETVVNMFDGMNFMKKVPTAEKPEKTARKAKTAKTAKTEKTKSKKQK